MITYVEGSLFHSPAGVLVNTVNTVGVMGKGIAADFRKLYPGMYEEYRTLCEAGKIEIGTLWLYRSANKSVLNFPTKQDWRRPSDLKFIEAGLRAFVRMYQAAGISSIAFPALGCGNGGLDFEGAVRPLMEHYLRDTKANVFIYPHRHSLVLPEHQDIETVSQWLRGSPEDMSFVEVWAELTAAVARGVGIPATESFPAIQYANQSEPRAIVCSWGSERYELEYEQVLEVWTELRAMGFTDCRVSGSVSSLLAHALKGLLSLLPYVSEVRLAPSYESESAFRAHARAGVQFLPRTSLPSSDTQLSLVDAL